MDPVAPPPSPADLPAWEARCEAFLRDRPAADPAHDLDHVRRVVATAKAIAEAEGARPAVVVPAAWLHDCVTVDKHAPERARASTLAADAARRFLAGAGYPAGWLDAVHHAVRAHSFSAGIAPETVEAKVVQDADRLDALGAVGLARCLMLGGQLGLALYHPADPFCRARDPDDRRYVVDHFFAKLLTLPRTMQTAAGRREAARRVRLLETFLEQLERELPAS